MSAQLFVYTRQNIALSDALSAFAAVIGTNGATAILYSPHRCELATFAAGELRDSDGKSVDIGSVFEARVFNEMAELRWLNDPSPEQRHQGVILNEQEVPANLQGWNMEPRNDVIEGLGQTYLLWGEGTDQAVKHGWSELATARIGALPVPIDGVGKNDRVLLRTREYIVEAEHGNAVVFDERLLKLEVIRG
jgi:CRISPR-associated protein (TIGR03984 family)